MSALLDEFHEVTADAGRPPVHVHSVSRSLRVSRDAGKKKMREEGVCRLCLDSYVRLTRHHLVPKSRFESGRYGMLSAGWVRVRDADANIVPLCRVCHDQVEVQVAKRILLRLVLTQAEISYCVQIAGKAWFDARYPTRQAALAVR